MRPCEKLFDELDELYQAAMDEQKRMRAVEEEISAEMTRIALKHYPALGELEPEQLRELGDLISRAASAFSMKLENVAH